jgi:hypothetical protein
MANGEYRLNNNNQSKKALPLWHIFLANKDQQGITTTMTISKELKTRSKQTEKHFLEKTLRGNICGRSRMNTANSSSKKARDKQSRR